MEKEIKKLKWEKGDKIAIFKKIDLENLVSPTNNEELIGGKIKEIIDTINKIIDYLTELKIKD